jgi:GTPase
MSQQHTQIPPEPFRSGTVSLVGRTNVGKSTLLNAMVGEKISIISPKVQTTRHAIRGIRTTPRAQIVFIDTPGFLLAPKNALDQKMTAHAREGIEKVDLVLHMVTPYDHESPESSSIVEMLRIQNLKAFLVINKVDLIKKEDLLPLIDRYAKTGIFQEIYPISALKGDNLPELESGIIACLPEGAPIYDPEQVSTENLRALVAEIVREKVYTYTHQEIPYSAAIQIAEFKEDEDLTRIEAIIYVEKESQKGIVIGKQAVMIRQIGSVARPDIERLLGRKVFLSLKVKLRKNWRSDEQFIRQLGM